ncbi:hypothetical protein [Amycolatopsis sp. NPDC051903]|uniref:hypothetical protein n=1 Tax=Amycolatopsis sp. NPDC051903 TaxID=3363936 RepID=UPI00379C7C99
MSVEALNDLAQRYVDPVLKEAGFTKRRQRVWSLVSPEGHAVLAKIRAWPTAPEYSFFVETAAIPAVLREYHDNGARSARLNDGWQLFLTRLDVPADLNTAPIPVNDVWRFLPAEIDEYGPKIRDHFREVAVPLWRSWLELPTLAEISARRDPDLSVMFGYGPGFAKVILEIDTGDAGELEERITDLIAHGADRKLLEWLRRRLHARTR